MSTEGSTTSESGSTEDLYPADQPVVEINNNLDDAEPQPNNEIIQNIVSKLYDNKGGKRKMRKTRTKKMRKTRTKKMMKTRTKKMRKTRTKKMRKTRTSNRKSRKMRKSKKQK